MHTFYFKAHQPNKLLLFLWPFLAIAKSISWYHSREQLDLFVAILFAIAAVLSLLGIRKKVKAYLLIDADGIEWCHDHMVQPIKIMREDIKWIKFENKGLSIYQASSFREFISLKDLKPAEQESVKQLLDHYPKGA